MNADLISLADVARLIAVPYAQLYRRTFEPDFPTKRTGSRFNRTEIYEWLVSHGLKSRAEIVAIHSDVLVKCAQRKEHRARQLRNAKRKERAAAK